MISGSIVEPPVVVSGSLVDVSLDAASSSMCCRVRQPTPRIAAITSTHRPPAPTRPSTMQPRYRPRVAATSAADAHGDVEHAPI
jgi:hypothetical protein